VDLIAITIVDLIGVLTPARDREGIRKKAEVHLRHLVVLAAKTPGKEGEIDREAVDQEAVGGRGIIPLLIPMIEDDNLPRLLDDGLIHMKEEVGESTIPVLRHVLLRGMQEGGRYLSTVVAE